MLRYGETEAAAIADLYASLPVEKFVETMVNGLNLAFIRGAADAFRSIGEAADEKVEALLAKDPAEIEDQSIVGALTSGLLAYEAVGNECKRQYDNLQYGGLELIAVAGVDEASVEDTGSSPMAEAPRVNAQVEGFKYEDLNLVTGPEAAR